MEQAPRLRPRLDAVSSPVVTVAVDEAAVAARLKEARARLQRSAAIAPAAVTHYRRPLELPFTSDQRDRVTILFGGLTWKHERLIQAALEACGYTCQPLPQPDLAACELGKQFGNNGLCNPSYFTVGNLIAFLLRLEGEGLSRHEIIDRYVFFTAGSCGPCRFGMYEAEYRHALRNAGFDGFRILLFEQSHGVKANTGHPGLELSLHLGLSALNAFNLADALHEAAYAIRPFELVPGATDAAIAAATEALAGPIAACRPFEPERDLQSAALRALAARSRPAWRVFRGMGMWRRHLRSQPLQQALAESRAQLDRIEVDWLRVRPVVKITGEFWAQTTETDGNFNMFAFLEREGAHVLVEPVGAWVTYLIHQALAHARNRQGLQEEEATGWRARRRARWVERRKILLLRLAGAVFRREHARVATALGGHAHPLVDQAELARLADPHYRSLARGGEGHLEVGKNLYYTTSGRAHMVVSLKPFGCLPSLQSDGVQAAVVARCQDMLFVPIETAAEGELAAQSRVQMALVEARARARAEFQGALAKTGRSLDEIRAYVAARPDLRRASLLVPERPGIAGVAGNFVLHVHDLMTRGTRARG
jgi:predicted nucleotide-binding protein (sugar kinase/HSP70/actin superfamily)